MGGNRSAGQNLDSHPPPAKEGGERNALPTLKSSPREEPVDGKAIQAQSAKVTWEPYVPPVGSSIRGLDWKERKDGVLGRVPADAVVSPVDSVSVGCLLLAHHQN